MRLTIAGSLGVHSHSEVYLLFTYLFRPARTLVCCTCFLSCFLPLVPTVQGQTSPGAEQRPNLPSAPEPEQASATQPEATGNISGTVLDTNGAVVSGAHVTVSGSVGFSPRSMTSGADGQFQFPNLPAGTYRVSVTGEGMSSVRSEPIQLGPGEFRIAPTIRLAVAGVTTSVTVTADKEELAEQQVQIAVQQRVAGVIPNFFSSFDWDAPPMMAKQKFKLTSRALIDPVSFLAVAGIAGAEQYKGVFPAYGSGIEGYGKRYGAALANRISGDMLGRAVYPSIFHQDPRYFYKGTGTVRSRALYAVSRAFITRRDDGRSEPNYSQILGNFSGAAISNLYYPESDRGASLVILNGLADTGANMVSNLVREFLLKAITTHVPGGENGKP